MPLPDLQWLLKLDHYRQQAQIYSLDTCRLAQTPIQEELG